MKSYILNALMLSVFVVLTSCGNTTKTEKNDLAINTAVDIISADAYTVDVSNSHIDWIGSKPTGSHSGKLSLANGSFNFEKNTVKSGTFTIDMQSIEVTDIPKENDANASLVGHLKAPDFFDTEKYPTATFVILSSTAKDGKTMLNGNLTIKGITKPVSFPATIENKDNKVTLTSDLFAIDRTQWNIKYKSKSIFGDLGDKFINDTIELKVSLVAQK